MKIYFICHTPHTPSHMIDFLSLSLRFPADDMLKDKSYFSNGQLDKDGLVSFIKDIKKNTKLSDEDAAVLAASKWVTHWSRDIQRMKRR